MAELNEIQTRVNRLFGNIPTQVPTAALRASALVPPPVVPADAPAAFFSEFITEHLEEAITLAERFIEIADATPGADGLDAVVNEAATEKGRRPGGMVEHALMLFILHHPQGRTLRIPSLLTRSPGQVFPSSALRLGPAGPGPTYARSSQSSSTPPEHRLDWFREDPLANEHHQHWHVVYPRGGIPGTNPRRLKDRHGELFVYMHQQMLARYDAERLAIEDLGMVQPLANYHEPIPEGYDPGGLVTANGNGTFTEYAPRPAGIAMRDLAAAELGSAYSVHDHELRRDRIIDAIDSGFYRNGNQFVPAPEGHLGSDLLGKTNETTIDSVSRSYYGNHHGFGHVLIGLVIPNAQGVILNTATAIRDPAFWRWHRHIDDINFRHQERAAPHNFADIPAVSMRSNGTESQDIILCRLADVQAIGDAEKEGAEIGQHAFGNAGGNNNWNADFSSGTSTFIYQGAEHNLPAVDELTTEMKLGQFTLGNGHTVGFPYLSHDPYCYYIRLKNESNAAKSVTVRLFLVPTQSIDADTGQVDNPISDPHINNRRLWIEMDKFQHTLQADEEAVVFRQDSESSVIRRPVVDPGDVRDIEPSGDPEDGYCECGWPYHLLLPRGTAAGMYFRLFAIVTDGDIDRVPGPEHCGSMSFCGVRNEYPDTRPMGYPFDRPLGRGPWFQALVDRLPNASSRRVLVRCVNL